MVHKRTRLLRIFTALSVAETRSKVALELFQRCLTERRGTNLLRTCYSSYLVRGPVTKRNRSFRLSETGCECGVTGAEKRAHHNALERKRRDHIKDSFSSLRESVPALQGEKVVSSSKVSRALILKKAADYIQFMRRKNSAHQQDIDDLKRQNNLLETQIRTLEKAKATGNYAVESSEVALVNSHSGSISSYPQETESDTSDSETAHKTRRPKKLKVAAGL
uniref:Protein max n=1 Tax=Timema monikensis TaxID=170555 RepID=A0A7R9ECT5_9NEOP|nr:unnamed protein product [Timema monikensis]